MRKVLVTGARGFIGKNLVVFLNQRDDVDVILLDKQTSPAMRAVYLEESDVIFHLAGINRPVAGESFGVGNADFTSALCADLAKREKPVHLVMTSSVQAELDNPYGVSKLRAEEAMVQFGARTDSTIAIYRLRNVFGKWCLPNYNSVTATFCSNIANDLAIQISNPASEIDLAYIDDVVAELASELDCPCSSGSGYVEDRMPHYALTLGELAARIQAFHEVRTQSTAPDMSSRFNQCLYATYLSYVPAAKLEFGLDIKSDDRGQLAEFLRCASFGQIFVSLTRPGVVRGNHFHHTKVEKFLVLTGAALVRLRQLESSKVEEYRIEGADYKVIDIPPGYTHSIQNIGDSDMTTLFWASEPFDPNRADTYYVEV